MYHLAAFTTNFAAAATDGQMNAVQDQHFTISAANRFILPYDGDILAAVAIGATATRSRIVAPSLRAIGFPQVRPIIVGAAVPTRPPVSEWQSGYTPRVRRTEELSMDITNGAIERGVGFIFVQRDHRPAPLAPSHAIRFTAAITGSAFQWDSGTLTPADVLPSGRYAVTGLSVVGANCMAARLIFPESGPRPGCLCSVQAADTDEQRWRNGRYGVLGEFDQTALPTLELFKSAAAVTQEIVMDLVKVS